MAAAFGPILANSLSDRAQQTIKNFNSNELYGERHAIFRLKIVHWRTEHISKNMLTIKHWLFHTRQKGGTESSAPQNDYIAKVLSVKTLVAAMDKLVAGAT
jgi:hypothetical protein